jgi:hypothetical protein
MPDKNWALMLRLSGAKCLFFFFPFPVYPFRKASDSEDLPLANPRTRFSKRINRKRKKEKQAFGTWICRSFVWSY